jgi:transcriptional regulator with PAS, ATPase and Fis domain
MDFWEVVHPDQQALVKQRGLARLRGEDVPGNYEIKALRKNGEIIWGDVFFSRTLLGPENVVIVGVYDITERKRLEEVIEKAQQELENRVKEKTAELRKANQELTVLNQNLNSVVQNMPDGVIMVDAKGEIQVLNHSFREHWDFIVNNLKQLIRKGLETGQFDFLTRLFTEGKPFSGEEFILPGPQGQVHFLAFGTPITDEASQVTHALILTRPIEEVHRLVNQFSGAQAHFRFEDIITRSPNMLKVIEKSRMAAASQGIVLIEGESGTGKEMFAHAIHNASSRARGPFVVLNCAAIPRDLVGSELFGYVEGAFTGAKRGGNPGKFELAAGGTLFLDEIGDMPFEQQATLLRVLQDRQLTRVGGNQVISVDVRIICATNKDLQTAVKSGNFRGDLFYRLNVINLRIPPLRERREDIPLLVDYFLNRLGKKLPEPGEQLEPEESRALREYDWPGNIRELQNLVEKIVYTGGQSDNYAALLNQHLISESGYDKLGLSTVPSPSDADPTIRQLREQQMQNLAEQERAMIIKLLTKYRGNVSRVARELGMARSTLYRKMEQYRVSEETDDV